MGFRQCNHNEKKLAEILGLDVDTVDAALKESRTGGFARIWTVEDKGNYSSVKISTSKKRKDGSYETDFQDGYVRFIGSAHEKVQELNVPDKGIAIQITSCEVTTPYNAETKKGYTNFAVFAFDIPDSNDGGDAAPTKSNKKSTAKTSKAKTKKAAPVDDEQGEDDLPF